VETARRTNTVRSANTRGLSADAQGERVRAGGLECDDPSAPTGPTATPSTSRSPSAPSRGRRSRQHHVRSTQSAIPAPESNSGLPQPTSLSRAHLRRGGCGSPAVCSAAPATTSSLICCLGALRAAPSVRPPSPSSRHDGRTTRGQHLMPGTVAARPRSHLAGWWAGSIDDRDRQSLAQPSTPA
jgi:hypothetical protein